jgi:arylsulfatase
MSVAMQRRKITAGTGIALILATVAPAQSQPAAPQAQWKAYPPEKMAPKGAPNVLVILTDDVGFGAASTFGGPVPTPTFDALAKAGLRYNAFHTTAMCSPTRAALLTGRNHHAVASGSIADVSADEPGYTSVVPKSAATIARVLKDNGYDTSFYGKNHNTPVWENTPVGPYDNWPNAWGFDYFYGFNGAFANQFHPSLIENRNPVRPPDEPDYHLDRDMTNHLIGWLQNQHTLRPDHPFFAYYASGTTHAPHQVPKDWIDRFKGKFDQGWDKVREETFARQKALGVIPANAINTPRPDNLPAWDSLSPALKKSYARMMEVAAAQLAYFDDQMGRVVEQLRRTGELDNTMIVYIQGDNGASEEDYRGSSNELRVIGGAEMSDADLVRDIEKHGGPETFPNYPSSWAWATNAPFQWGKRIASHLGGLRDGMVVSWPARIKQTGQVRSQFTHLIDIAPTIYEAAGIAPPRTVDGVAQLPIDGTSFLYSFDDANAPERHREQYFEMLGNRSYYRDGWMASTIPGRMPWNQAVGPDPKDFKWALFNLREDFSQSRDVSAQFPAKLAELQKAFDVAARKNNVYPLDGNLNSRMVPQYRPNLLGNRTSFTYYPGETRYNNYSFPALAPGWRLKASVGIAGPSSDGPIMVQGDHFGGQALIVDQGRPTYIYNSGEGPHALVLAPDAPVAPGRHDIAVTFSAPGGGRRGTAIALMIDGKTVAHAETDALARGRGDAYVGRRGITPLYYDPQLPQIAEICSCTIDFVTIEKTDSGN